MDKTSSLPPAILQIVQNKGTEPPFSGTHAPLQEAGTYLCRRCGLAPFRTDAQFHSGCGWPSFDQTIPKTVTQQPDADGIRTELLCARCQAHLGHLFEEKASPPETSRTASKSSAWVSSPMRKCWIRKRRF